MINLLDIIKCLFKCKAQLLTNRDLLDILDKDICLSPERLAIYIYRLQNQVIQNFGTDKGDAQEVLQVLTYIQRMFTQMEIYYSAVIGDNLEITHGLGTVIGSRVVIGNNVTIFQNVTLGGKKNFDSRPVIGDNTVIGAGSIVLGGINIGKNCIIGANSVVLESFPDDSVIAGSPAKLIKNNNDEIRARCP